MKKKHLLKNLTVKSFITSEEVSNIKTVKGGGWSYPCNHRTKVVQCAPSGNCETQEVVLCAPASDAVISKCVWC